jgi:mRNA interferase RelE/StbE
MLTAPARTPVTDFESALRVGHYRVVYEWQRNELLILVVRISHRREVYR